MPGRGGDVRVRRAPVDGPAVETSRTRRGPIDLGPLRPLHPSLTALRPDDLLALRITWVNMLLEGGKLVRGAANRAAYLIVELEPQHVAEEAYFELAKGYPVSDKDLLDAKTKTPSPLPDPGVAAQARLAGRSRLAFKVPASVPEIPCTLAGILGACSDLPLSVTATAVPPETPFRKIAGKQAKKKTPKGPSHVEKPAPEQTAIEAPWRLELSPNEFCAWLHARDLVVDAATGRVELWHTRLGTREAATIHDGRYTHARDASGEWGVTEIRDVPLEHNRTVRAVWSPDHVEVGPVEPPKNKPFRMSLDPNDRHQLVGLTGDPKVPGWRSRVVHTRRLMLSSLGAWLDLDYAHDHPAGFSLVAWRHLAASGRDNYVRVVYAGHLCGLKNTASLVKVTERKFGRREGSVTDDAFLRQRMYVIVREPEVEYPAQRRCMPFRKIRLTTLVTPNLDPPEQAGVQVDQLNRTAMWLTVNGEPFLFHGIAWDWEGRPSEFALPLIFVDDTVSPNTVETVVIPEYNERIGGDGKLLRSRPFHGQPVAYASNRDDPGSTSLETASVEFFVEPNKKTPPFFEPCVDSAHVRVPAVEQLVGHSAQPVKITIDDDYVQNDWPATPKGEVFARIADPGSMVMKFGANRSGGVATPSLNVGGLSRRFGPVGGPAAAVKSFNTNGNFDPEQYFGGIEARILGGIDLFRIVKGMFGDGTVPKLISTPIGNPAAPTAIETKLDWTPQIKEFGPFKPNDPVSGLKLTALVHTDLASGASVSTVHGELKDFDMNLFGFVVLPFKELTFDANSSEKTHVSADLGEVTFGGPLEFVNELKDYLGGDGFNDPPGIDVTSEGVRVGYSLELPSIAVGVMTLQNISFGAALNLPFTGDPVRFRFNFCEREHPFHLLIYCFGGGGSFAISIGLDGVEQIEAQLEFGAAISIDIGVASGGVHLMAGIYYSWKEAEQKAWLEGYLRMGGELDVLGIVSMSLEFVMSLAYDSGPPSIVWGEAKLTVEIDVLCFSDSVTMSVRRELGDPDRPLIEDMFTADDWSAYWGAFAKAA
jgi:hypothetical protein